MLYIVNMDATQTNHGASGMKKITLTNDFHNTSVTLIVKDHNPGDAVEISSSQYYRARRALCGMETCGCGDTRGGDYALYSDHDRYGDLCYYVEAALTEEQIREDQAAYGAQLDRERNELNSCIDCM
jgi:hypothetical protein